MKNGAAVDRPRLCPGLRPVVVECPSADASRSPLSEQGGPQLAVASQLHGTVSSGASIPPLGIKTEAVDASACPGIYMYNRAILRFSTVRSMEA